MPLRVFVTGATGVVGRALLPQLRARGHHVTAMVRDQSQVAQVADADGVVVADLLDGERLRAVVKEASPDVVVHQVTGLRGEDFGAGLTRTAQLFESGARNLVSAAAAGGARRVVAQSSALLYAPAGHDVLDEEAPLWTEAPGRWGELVRSVAILEESLLTAPSIEGVALRYGALYGAETAYAPGGRLHQLVREGGLPLVRDGAGITSFTHVDDAAGAVLEVLDGGDPGAYNVVDNEPAESVEWLPAYARMIDAPAPPHLTQDEAREQLDWLTVHWMTEQRGATNFRFRETLGWRPVWPSWREGFATLFGLWPG